MRLLKAQNTNLRNIYGKGVKYDVDDQVIIDSHNVMLIPKGNTAERPIGPTNGHLRYNTDTEEFEAYSNGTWRNLRYKEPYGANNNDPGIVVQTLGFGSVDMLGDYNEIYFGPLDSQDPNADHDYTAPSNPQDVLVFVENVYQLPNTNYTLEQNPAKTNIISSIISTGVTTVIQTLTDHNYSADDLVYIENVDSGGDNIENLNTPGASPMSFTIASIPATNQIEIEIDTTGGNVGNYVANSGTIKRASSIDGQFYPDGWYIKFSSAPDVGKQVTVLHNFNK